MGRPAEADETGEAARSGEADRSGASETPPAEADAGHGAGGLGLVERVLAGAPSKRILDLGCGAGRHARWLAERGYSVVGIDASDAAIERAKAAPVPEGVEFYLGDMGAVEGAVRGHFGGAICLGNTLPYLLTPESLSRMLVGLRRRSLAGAPFVFEVLNYDRIFAGAERALPLEVVPSPEGELIVLELLKVQEPGEEGIVIHSRATLRHQPGASTPIEVVGSTQSQLRGWRRGELEAMLDVARWPDRELYGDLAGAPFDAAESLELVVVAR